MIKNKKFGGKRMMNKKSLFWLFAMMLTLTMFLAACSEDAKEETPVEDTKTDTPTNTDTPAAELAEGAPLQCYGSFFLWSACRNRR